MKKTAILAVAAITILAAVSAVAASKSPRHAARPFPRRMKPGRVPGSRAMRFRSTARLAQLHARPKRRFATPFARRDARSTEVARLVARSPIETKTIVTASVIGAVGIASAALIYTFLGPWGLLFVALAVGAMELANLVKRDVVAATAVSTAATDDVEQTLETRFAQDMKSQSWSTTVESVHSRYLGRRSVEEAVADAVQDMGGEDAFCEFNAEADEPHGVEAVVRVLKTKAIAFTDHVMDHLEDNEPADEQAVQEEHRLERRDDYHHHAPKYGHGHHHGHGRKPVHRHPPTKKPTPAPPTPELPEGEKTVWAGLKRVFRSWVRKTKEWFQGKRPLNRRSTEDTAHVSFRDRVRAWFDRLRVKAHELRERMFGPRRRAAVHKKVEKRVERARAGIRKSVVHACKQQ